MVIMTQVHHLSTKEEGENLQFVPVHIPRTLIKVIL